MSVAVQRVDTSVNTPSVPTVYATMRTLHTATAGESFHAACPPESVRLIALGWTSIDTSRATNA